MKFFYLFIGMILFFMSEALAIESKFDCNYHNYADSQGGRKFSNPLNFRILWDVDNKQAFLKTSKKSIKLIINDSLDFVSFVASSQGGKVLILSITKNNGESVYSINQFGLSQQAYGFCKLSL